VNGNTDVWLVDTARGTREPFTFDPVVELNPHWSADGTHLIYQAARRGAGFYDLYLKPVAGGPGSEKALLETRENKNLTDWSQDGRLILYSSYSPRTGTDSWAFRLTGGDAKPFAVVQTPHNDLFARISPDSRWIVYTSNVTGRNEIYLQRFPEAGRTARVSTNGGNLARWAVDGREVFYIGPDSRLMSVRVELPAAGDPGAHPPPVALFTLPPREWYGVPPSGDRFLINAVIEDVPPPPITVMQNWTGERADVLP
jgi:Tol biopolymer transport system component